MALTKRSSEVGGAIDYLTKEAPEAELIPLLVAHGFANAPLSGACWEEVSGGLLSRLREARSRGPIDAVYLANHGSMAVVRETAGGLSYDDDPEGSLAASVREIVGEDAVLVMSLDLHANVTRRMVERCDAIVSYDHYPHDDVFRTGQRSARLLLGAARKEIRLGMVAAKLPMMQSGFGGQTFTDRPCLMGDVLRRAKSVEGPWLYERPMKDPSGWMAPGKWHYGEDLSGETVEAPLLLCVTVNMAHPHNDFPEMGNTAVAVFDANVGGAAEEAEQQARALLSQVWARRIELAVPTYAVAEAVRRGRLLEGPVILLDLADCIGGGAAGDSVATVAGLLAAGVTERCLTVVIDPAAASACVAAGVGAQLAVHVGHSIDDASTRAKYGFEPWGEPAELRGTVLSAEAEAAFTYTGGVFGGTEWSMGAAAVLAVGEGGNIHVLIMSQPTYDWRDEQFKRMGIDVASAKFVQAKNPMNWRSAFAGVTDVSTNYFVLDVPGPTAPVLGPLPFKRLPAPLWMPPKWVDGQWEAERVSELSMDVYRS